MESFFLYKTITLTALSSPERYGLNSVPVMAQTANIYLNFGLWGLSLITAWFVISEIGVTLGDKKIEREIGSGRFNQDEEALKLMRRH